MTAGMKIVITHTDFRLYWSARLMNLEQMLTAKGHQLTIIEIAGQGSPYAFAGNDQSHSSLDWECLFPGETMAGLPISLVSREICFRLEQIQPDIVLAGAVAFPSGAVAVRWCKANGKPVIIFDNARLADVPRMWLVNYIKRCIYRNVDAVISPAPSQAEAFEFWGVKKDKIFFGLNVVDNDWFSRKVIKSDEKQKLLRKVLELPELFFLGVGRLVQKKNWLRLVQCFASRVKDEQQTDWHLVLVGDGPEKETIKNYCDEKNLNNIILRGFVSQDELCNYYSLASALVLPSAYGETWGLVVNEAMASGLPVLVSNQCGCVDSLVEDGRNGYVFSPEDSSEISEALQKFIDLQAEERGAMGKRSEAIIKNWSLDRFSHAVWQAIEHCRTSPGSSPDVLDSLIIKSWKGRYRPT